MRPVLSPASLDAHGMMLRCWQEATGAYLEELREQRNSLDAATTSPKSRISTSCAWSRPDRLVRVERQHLKEEIHESTVL